MSVFVSPIIDGVIQGEEHAWNHACQLLHAYFFPENNYSHSFYLLRSCAAPHPHLLDSSDIIALLAMGIGEVKKVRHLAIPPTNHDDLNTPALSQLQEMFEAIPDNCELVDAPDTLFSSDGAIRKAWNLLTSSSATFSSYTENPRVSYGLKKSTAIALLARKRPGLIPLLLRSQLSILSSCHDTVDAICQCRDILQYDNKRGAHQLYYLREATNLPQELHIAEILSVLLYAEAKERSHQKKIQKKTLKKAQKEMRKNLSKKGERELAGQNFKKKKQQKKLAKIQAKKIAKRLKKAEYAYAKKLQEQIERTNPISTDAFKLRPTSGHHEDDEFTYSATDDNRFHTAIFNGESSGLDNADTSKGAFRPQVYDAHESDI